MCLETGENENCLETGEHEKCLETGENEKCLETRENEKCLDTGKIQHFPLRAERRRREARGEMFATPGLVTTQRSSFCKCLKSSPRNFFVALDCRIICIFKKV